MAANAAKITLYSMNKDGSGGGLGELVGNNGTRNTDAEKKCLCLTLFHPLLAIWCSLQVPFSSA